MTQQAYIGTGRPLARKGLRVKGYRIVLSLVLFALAGVFCLRPPEVPSWDTELSLPLYAGRLDLVDLLDSAHFHLGPDSTIEFMQVVPFDTVHPDDAFELVGVDEQRRISIADFAFREVATIVVKLSVKEMLGSVVPDSGGKTRLEPFSMEREMTVTVDGVEDADLLGGTIAVTLSNYTTIPFDSVVVGTQAGIAMLGTVEPGETRTTRLAISDARIASPMPLRLVVGSPGSGPDSVVLSAWDSLVVRVQLDSVHLSTGRLRLPSAQVIRRCPIQLVSKTSMRIDRLEVEQGSCEVVVSNWLDVPLRASLVIPQLGTTTEGQVERRSSISADIDLRGLVLDNGGQINSPVSLWVTALLEGNSNWVDLHKDDGVEISYVATGLRPRSVAGRLWEPAYVASQTRQMLALPNGMRGLRMSRVTMVMNLENRVGFPIELLADVRAIRRGVVVGTAKHTFVLQASVPGEPTQSQQWMIPLQELTNTGADSIRWECNARIMGEGHFQIGQCVAGDGLVSSPLRMAMVPDTIRLPSCTIQLRDNQLERLKGRLVSGEVALSVANHLPMSVSGRVILSPTYVRGVDSLAHVDSVVVPFVAPAGLLGHDGSCVASSDTAAEVVIDSSEAAIFRNDSLAVGVMFELPQSDTVVITARDGLQIRAVARMRVRMGESQ